MTGAEDPRTLNASHILSWSDHPQHRMWPTNGICLNALHDRALDRQMISLDEDWHMIVAPQVPAGTVRLLKHGTDGHMHMPARFQPDPAFMASHRAQLFAGR